VGSSRGLLLQPASGGVIARMEVVAAWKLAEAAYEALRARSDSLVDGHEDEDAAVDEYCTAMDRLVERTPAPDSAALMRKMASARERWAESGVPDAWLASMASDVQRLSAEGALA